MTKIRSVTEKSSSSLVDQPAIKIGQLNSESEFSSNQGVKLTNMRKAAPLDPKSENYDEMISGISNLPMGKFKSQQTKSDFRRGLTLTINKDEKPSADKKVELDKISKMDGNSSDDESYTSQISHLSLAHTNELLTKKRLDSENRPSKIKLQAGSQMTEMKEKQKDFDKEASKQFKKQCYIAKMERRMNRMKNKYTPEEFKIKQASLKRQLQRHLEEHDHNGNHKHDHTHDDVSALSEESHSHSHAGQRDEDAAEAGLTFRGKEQKQQQEMPIDEYIDQNQEEQDFFEQDRQKYVSFAGVRPSTQE